MARAIGVWMFAFHLGRGISLTSSRSRLGERRIGDRDRDLDPGPPAAPPREPLRERERRAGERLRERLRERLLLRERDIAGSAFLLCVRTAS